MTIKININPSLLWVLCFFILFVVLLYPPFVFFQFVNETFRIVLFSLVLLVLFVYQLNKQFQKKKFLLIVFLWSCLFFYFTTSLITNGTEGARTAIGYALILTFAVILFGIIQSENGAKFYKLILGVYIFFFFLVPIFCICGFLINLITPSFNFLSPYFSDFVYNYQVSPFGLVIPKSILGISLSRNFFFFIEPVYLALFYLINVFIVGKYVPRNSKAFILLNIIGGLLTASYFFFIGFVIVKFLKMNIVHKILTLLVASALVFLFFNNFSNFFSDSSYGDRFLRIEIAIEILKNFKATNLILGTGYLFDHGFNKGVSSGIFASFIEGGIIGLILPLLIALIICRKNMALFAIVILSLLLFEPYKLPFFWFVIVIAGSLPKEISKNIIVKEQS